jgi:Lrp/AsnC family transcriptional regulator, leucine-responsive regulatory protein
MNPAQDVDSLDLSLLRVLLEDARISHVDLGNQVGLSSTACARRMKQLEGSGVIRNYHAALDPKLLGVGAVVIVRITLEGQTEEELTHFETAVAECPEVFTCYLMSGVDDYLVMVAARDIADYERIHKDVLSRLPGVSRIQSSFTLRQVVNRSIAYGVLAPPRTRAR